MNTHIDKGKNNKYYFHDSLNRNLAEFSLNFRNARYGLVFTVTYTLLFDDPDRRPDVIQKTWIEVVVSPPLLRSVNGAVNTTSTEILVLTSTSAKECYPRIHRLLSSLLSPFLSRSPSPSGQSAEIVAVAEDDPRTEEEAVAEEIPDRKHVCWPPDIFLANTWRCIRRIKFLF